MSEPRPLRDALDQVMRSLGAPDASTVRTVFSEWETVVGPSIAAHARPRSLDAGTLVVLVDEPGWATQLRYLEAELLARLGAAAGTGTVTRIEVRVRPA